MKTTFQSTDFAFSWLKLADVEDAYQLSRVHGGEDFWERESFDLLLRSDDYGCLKVTHRETKQLVGFLAFQKREKDVRILRLLVTPHLPSSATGKICETSCLDPSEYRDNLSKALLKALTTVGLERRRPLTTIVRESDLESQLFWKRMGFRCEKTQKNWFDCPPETGYLFVKRQEEKK